MVGGRSGVALNFHCGCPEGARTCAVPSPAIVKGRSLVPLGACSAGAISVTPPPATTSSVPPLERTISVLPAGTGNGPAVGVAASLFAADKMIGGLPVYRGGVTQASTLILAGESTPFQSNAATVRNVRSSPAAI